MLHLFNGLGGRLALAQRTGTSLMSRLLRVPVNTSAMGATSSKRRSSARDLHKTSIENIPEPLILEIFSYLSLKELCQIARVCKQWHRITRDNKLWSHVDITPDALNHERMWTFLSSHFSEVLQTFKLRSEYSPADKRLDVNLSTAMLQDLQGWFPNLQTLWLHNCNLQPVNAALLPSSLHTLDLDWSVVPHRWFKPIEMGSLKNLKVLKLSRCNQHYPISLSDFEHISKLAALEVLDLGNCFMLTDDKLRVVATKLTCLTELRINQTDCTNRALHHISRNLKKLKVLDVSETGLSDAAVGSVISSLKNLKVLKLSGCRITMTNLEHIGKVAALEVLDLSYCWRVTDDGLRVVAEKLTCLTKLCIKGTRYTDLALTHISSNLKNLKLLDVPMTGLLDLIAVGSVGSSKKNLKVLNLGCSHISIKYLERISKIAALKILHIDTDDAVRVIAEKLTCLTELHINRARCTDLALHHISMNLKNLKLLDMSENSRLSDAAVGSVASGLKNLVHLNISGCEELTDTAVNGIANNLKQLEVFHFCNTNTTCEPVRSFSEKMPKLRDIAMGNIDDEGLESLFQLELVSLKVGVADLSDEGLSQLHKFKNLKKLTLNNCLSERAIQILKDQRPLHKFKNLKKLTLCKCQSERAIQIVKDQLPGCVVLT